MSRSCLRWRVTTRAEREFLLAQWEIVRQEPAFRRVSIRWSREGEAAIRPRCSSSKRTPRAHEARAHPCGVILAAVRATSMPAGDGATMDLVRLGKETFADLEHGLAAGLIDAVRLRRTPTKDAT